MAADDEDLEGVEDWEDEPSTLAMTHAAPGALAQQAPAGALSTGATRPRSGLSIDPQQVAAEYQAVVQAKKLQREGRAASDAQAQVDDALVEEKILGSKCAWRGSFLTVDSVDVQLPNGDATVHEVVRHPGAVAIIALDGTGRILLVHQYRTALERVTHEIPAGKLDPGEDIEECARRELSEETGYTAGTLRYLIPVATAAGYSDEIIHLFMATDLTPGEQHPDSDEFIAVEWADLKDFINDVLDGKVEDSKTIIAAFICDAIAHRL